MINNLGKVAPGPAKTIFTNAIHNVGGHRGTAAILFIAGLLVALWSASGYIAAFMRASNRVYDIAEGRPIWMTAPIRVGVTIVAVVFLVAMAVIVVVTGPVARAVGDTIGAGSTAGCCASAYNAHAMPLPVVSCPARKTVITSSWTSCSLIDVPVSG